MSPLLTQTQITLLLDNGRLTDGQGRTVDFRNVVLILTSNLGSHLLVSDMPDASKKLRFIRASDRKAGFAG